MEKAFLPALVAGAAMLGLAVGATRLSAAAKKSPTTRPARPAVKSAPRTLEFRLAQYLEERPARVPRGHKLVKSEARTGYFLAHWKSDYRAGIKFAQIRGNTARNAGRRNEVGEYIVIELEKKDWPGFAKFTARYRGRYVIITCRGSVLGVTRLNQPISTGQVILPVTSYSKERLAVLFKTK